jgi:hypothetical protein
MSKVKLITLVISYLTLLLNPLKAEEKKGSLEDIVDFIESNPTKVKQSNNKEESPEKLIELPKSLPANLLFLNFKEKPLPDLKPSLEAKPGEIAKWLKEQDLSKAYDKRYEEYQEFILINSDAISEKQKEQIENLFAEINEELNKLENITVIKNHDESLLGPLVPTKGHKPISTNSLGEQASEDIENGSSNIRVSDSPKRSILRKPSFGFEKGPDEEEKISSLNILDGVCQDKNSKSIVPIDLNLLSKNVVVLERALLDESNTLDERIKIYCTLLKYYELTENNDRLIDFLYLNMPADEVKCP